MNKTATNLPEPIRKLIVSLKRKPQTIPMIALAITFLVYSLNLTMISNTTAKIQGVGMGLCGFATMLFSLLSFVCFMNAFPVRKKVNLPMLVLMFVMLAIIWFCDNTYTNIAVTAITRTENPIQLSMNTLYIAKAINMLSAHMTCLWISVALIVLLPVYSKYLRKIKTSIEVEDNGKLAQIDIVEE